MKAKNCATALYVSYGKESTTFIKLMFDPQIWAVIWDLMEELYAEVPRKWMGVPGYKKQVTKDLKEYILCNSELLVEVPSCIGMQSPVDSSLADGPYFSPEAPAFTLTSSQSIADSIQVMCANSLPMVEDGYQVLREKATEILAFIITDVDRQFCHDIPPHMPLAYAMKGRCLPISTMREMMRRVRLRCQEAGTSILSESFDGQWAMMIFKDTNGLPLTRLQVAKRLWTHEKKKKKLDLLKQLEERVNMCSHSVKNSNGFSVSSDICLSEITTSVSPQIWSTPCMKRKLTKSTALARAHITITDIECLRVKFRVEDVDTVGTTIGKIHTRLTNLNAEKWQHVNNVTLKYDILAKPEKLKKLLVVEMNSIAGVVKQVTGKEIYESNMKKHDKVNILNRIFGTGHNVEMKHAVPKLPRSVKSLAAQCRQVITRSTYPKEVLAAAVCHYTFPAVEEKWEKHCTLPSHIINLPFINKEHRVYWYPEYDEYLGENLMRSLDPSHLLTNLRTAITQKGALGVRPSHYREVCEAKILPSVIIEDNLDQQNVEAAKNCFGEKVERFLVDKNHLNAARTVRTVRYWYEACDERGLSATRRAKRLHEMTELLTEGINFDDFPPPGSHVNGVPLITFEGILQCNTLRLALYNYAQNGTYNHRAISTLAAESFFSDISAMEFTTTGCPKAIQIPTLIGQVTQMNKHKHDPLKYFFMEITSRSVYPTRPMDLVEGEHVRATSEDTSYFKNHQFDVLVTQSERRRLGKAFVVNHPDKTAKGTRGVRQHYKVDQSKIPDSKKL
jgi:hypothetical protein